MALKKSQLYASLWQSCDELRGGMDASQYKDYVLTLLFMKYVSDKYAGKPDALIEIPKGGGFADMVKLKGDKEIGERINKIIAKLAGANDLKGVTDQADFNDEGMPRADWGVMGAFEVKLPTVEEQWAIATVLSHVDAEIAALERRRDKTRAIKQGMMQQLLTGRVRLVEPQLADSAA